MLDTSTKKNTTIEDDFPENSIEAFCITPYPTEKMFFALTENDKVAAFRNFFKV